jgi:type VI secretion system secreted protein Hcp
MAVDVFLKLGNIKGESADHKHKDEIHLLSWSWGMSNEVQMTTAGAGAGKVSFGALRIVHYVDRATPELMLACASGTHFSSGRLTVRKAGERPMEYLKIDLGEVFVTNVEVSDGHADEHSIETVTLKFVSVRVTYALQRADGTC